ncbi:lipoprotein [Streptomyces sp. NRRL B-1140]|nr:lipoprotein [Streptomyces sp. NRRL B-1140]
MLAAAPAALVLTGCTGGDSGGPAPDGPAAADRARARAARDSEGLAERYDAVIAARPGLADRLRPLREEVVRHTQAFGGGRKASPSASPSVSVSASASPSPSLSVPGNDKDALAGLAAAERELADRRVKALGGAPGELARLLASVAAAGAAHVYLLTEGGA